MNKFMGRPDLEPTVFTSTKPGLNNIVVKTVHYGNQEMILEKDVPIKMRDGITIRVNVFRPMQPGKYPVVMSMDPYGKDSLPSFAANRSGWPVVGTIDTSEFASDESPDPGFWVPNDYVVVKVAARGSTTSEGDFYPWTRTETEDYYEIIEWAGVQEWSNGNVGLNGVSYLAMTTWRVAALNPPHLKAINPWEGTSDLYREWYFHGGIPETNFSVWFDNTLRMFWPNTRVEDMIGSQKEHPLLDEHWEQREVNLADITVPAFVVASWSTQGLHNRGTFEGFKKISSGDKWLMVHARKEWETYYRREELELQKTFFDYYLKGIENDWRDMPLVSYEAREKFYQSQARIESEWPIARTDYTPLHLNGGEMSLQAAPAGKEEKLCYNSEPGVVENSELRFQYTVSQNTEVTGYMKLKLWVSAADADDMDLFIGIKKYDRRGNEVLMADFNHIEHGQVANGWLRVSHRELDEEQSTPWQPVRRHKRLLKLAKDEIVPVEIDIWPTSVLLKEGESLVLVIKGSEIVSVEGEKGTAMRFGHYETVNKGTHCVYVGGKYDSHLLVPVIPQK